MEGGGGKGRGRRKEWEGREMGNGGRTGKEGCEREREGEREERRKEEKRVGRFYCFFKRMICVVPPILT